MKYVKIHDALKRRSFGCVKIVASFLVVIDVLREHIAAKSVKLLIGRIISLNA